MRSRLLDELSCHADQAANHIHIRTTSSALAQFFSLLFTLSRVVDSDSSVAMAENAEGYYGALAKTVGREVACENITVLSCSTPRFVSAT